MKDKRRDIRDRKNKTSLFLGRRFFRGGSSREREKTDHVRGHVEPKYEKQERQQ